MSLSLHFHPLSSYCWKVLIGLYENDIAFEPVIINLGDPASREPFIALWPLGKMPVLRDEARNETVPESTIILDYLDLYHPGRVRFTPADPEAARRVRLWDRTFDLHVHAHMQKIVGDRLRPDGGRDPVGVSQARSQLDVAYGLIERGLEGRTWLSEDQFGLAECAAFPALYYGDKVHPVGPDRPMTAAYLARLSQRPSVARVLSEAEPFFQYFPQA